MVDVGDPAPDFTLPLASGESYNDMEPFTLSDAVGSGPIVLAFYPAAFTQHCTDEMCSVRDSMDALKQLDAQVYGISVDLPFSQNIWIEENGLNFPMLSDWDHKIIRDYDVVYEDMYGMVEAAQRSVFILDEAGTVAYKWLEEGDSPDFDEFADRLEKEVASISQA